MHTHHSRRGPSSSDGCPIHAQLGVLERIAREVRDELLRREGQEAFPTACQRHHTPLGLELSFSFQEAKGFKRGWRGRDAWGHSQSRIGTVKASSLEIILGDLFWYLQSRYELNLNCEIIRKNRRLRCPTHQRLVPIQHDQELCETPVPPRSLLCPPRRECAGGVQR
jgi:hypothetical protein